MVNYTSDAETSEPSLATHRGRWVVLSSTGEIMAVGDTISEARTALGEVAGPASRALDDTHMVWISPRPPYVALPAWPILPIREMAAERQTTVWLAGGPVRDLLIGRRPRDWDFVVDPEGQGPQVALGLARAVADRLNGAYYPLDAERGTGRAIAADPRLAAHDKDVTLDFAALRAPDIEADLWERDFTINAMAMTLEGDLIDPTDGREDLAAHRLRLTQPTALRDDAARLLRAVRLAHQLRLEIDPATRRRILADASTLDSVAVERLEAELSKIMADPHAPQAMDDLARLDLLHRVLPQLAALQERDAWTTTLMTLAATMELLQRLRDDTALVPGAPAVPRWAWSEVERRVQIHQPGPDAYLRRSVTADATVEDLTRWGALLYAVGISPAPETTTATQTQLEQGRERIEAQLTDLRWANRAITFVTDLVASVDSFLALAARLEQRAMEGGPTEPRRREIFRYFGQPRRDGKESVGVAAALVALARTLAVEGTDLQPRSWSVHTSLAGSLLGAFLHHYDAWIDPPLLLTGRDLMAMGIEPGPQLGELLAKLKEAQAAGEVDTPEAAETYIREIVSSA